MEVWEKLDQEAVVNLTGAGLALAPTSGSQQPDLKESFHSEVCSRHVTLVGPYLFQGPNFDHLLRGSQLCGSRPGPPRHPPALNT